MACLSLAWAPRSSRTATIASWQTRTIQRSAVRCFLCNSSEFAILPAACHPASVLARNQKRRSSMKRVSLHLVVGIVFCLLVAMSASAQVARVFLAGTGNDAGDCTNQATPCRSLQGAVTQCPVDGEIIILDNGGYGGATIAKSLTVNASAGVVAFIARTITVNIASTDKVVLRGLSMNGVVFGDADGIAFTGGGTLVVENSVIAGFGLGGS